MEQNRLSDKNSTKLQNSIIVYVFFLFIMKSLAITFDRAILKTAKVNKFLGESLCKPGICCSSCGKGIGTPLPLLFWDSLPALLLKPFFTPAPFGSNNAH